MNIDLIDFTIDGRRVDAIKFDSEKNKWTVNTDPYGYGQGPTFEEAVRDLVRREEEDEDG